MTDYTTLTIRLDERRVAYVELNRPDKRNALSATMIDELTAFAGSITANGDIRLVVLSGAGKTFCAGGDLDWMRAQIEADRETRFREARKLAMMLNALNTIPVPLIGKIHGGAFGGGAGLACICDAVIADENSLFGLTETRLGLIPATISPYVIARIGEGRARRFFMSAKVFSAREAQRIGMVSEVVSADELDQTIEAEVSAFLSAAPKAMAEAKALARSLGMTIDDATIDESICRLVNIWEGAEVSEGVAAFFEKRNPGWLSYIPS